MRQRLWFFTLLVFLLAGLGTEGYGLSIVFPDFTIDLSTRSQVETGKRLKIVARVDNIGFVGPSRSVPVYLRLSFFHCVTGQGGVIQRLAYVHRWYLRAGYFVYVTFGPFRKPEQYLPWVLTEIVLIVDPFNRFTEENEENNQLFASVGFPCPEGQSGAGAVSPAPESVQVLPSSEESPSGLHTPLDFGFSQLQVFNLSGDKLLARELFDSTPAALIEEINRTLPNGVYFYILTARGERGEVLRKEVRKLVVVK